MLNSISVVGRIVKSVYHVHDKAFIDIEVKKPGMMDDVGEIGMFLAIRGRLVVNTENDKHSMIKNTVIYAELIETLNKYFYK